MGLLEMVGLRVPETEKAVEELPFSQIVQQYEVVSVHPEDGYMVVTDRHAESRKLDEPNYAELGTTGYSAWSNFNREDYNGSLRRELGWRMYDKMRRNDAQVRTSLLLAKTPIIAARWFVEPASNDERDTKIGKFIENNLFKWMSMSWPQFLMEALLMLDFGWYSFEKVFDIKKGAGGREYVIWRKFAPRHPLDLTEWDWDRNGGPNGARFYGPGESADSVYIPIEKLAVFSYQREAGDLEGISLLRSAYKHWYFKETLYKIDAIQKERHGIGIPVIKLPMGFKPEHRAAADQMGRNLRTNEKTHVVLPPNWEIIFAKLEGQPVDALKSIEHHDLMIARNVLGQFINADNNDQTSQTELFMKAARFTAEILRDVINKYCIPQLVDYNWSNVESYPELKVRRLGETIDLRTYTFAMRNAVGAALLTPDDPLEDWLRDEMDAPRRDPSTKREVAAPQLPKQPSAGPGGMGQGKNTDIGDDGSGG